MKTVGKAILKFLGWVLLLPIYIYKYAISPLTPASCRHVPTCSEYAVQAIKLHGPFKGFVLTVHRLSKCHPWGTHGYDPVPPKSPDSKKF
ncbi:membrane protein insertion efficiency factor YidD [uncultured Draconibacterium sp.]|uniref:membrane protein insertion efficiency factor YidD n=1 Tax=uncultured Draconibacterium sp. TaxID=1573823 RepID=UPI0025D04C5A|nr:membrane protein insertion efficiency factor YidD [uncultured Draconibacterium sp.]